MGAPWKARAGTHKLVPALLAVLVAGVIAVIGVFAAVSGGGKGGGTAASAARTASAASAGRTASAATAVPAADGAKRGTSASAGPSVSADPRQSPVTRGAKWVTGTAGRLLAAVNTDVGTISAAEHAGKYSTARSAGARLAADAAAALKGPMPPADVAVYRAALNDFEQIGTDTTRGNFRAASSLLATANIGIMEVTAAADPPAPVNPAAPVTDPSDG